MFNRVPSVDVGRAQQLLADGATLLDVRGDDEWHAGHAPQAMHLPLGQLPARAAEVPTDHRVVAVCRTGFRSAQATQFLRQSGVDVVNLDGGMQAWARTGAPIVGGGDGDGYVA